MAMYLVHMVCPRCGKTSSVAVADTRITKKLNCGECLMDFVEIVELKVVKVEEV